MNKIRLLQLKPDQTKSKSKQLFQFQLFQFLIFNFQLNQLCQLFQFQLFQFSAESVESVVSVAIFNFS